MKATEAKLLEFLKKSHQFVIPIYQRAYSWGERECRQLWDDLLRTCRNDDALVSLDELPYVMGLARQALEIQVGDGEDT